jgi:hypothetical protein
MSERTFRRGARLVAGVTFALLLVLLLLIRRLEPVHALLCLGGIAAVPLLGVAVCLWGGAGWRRLSLLPIAGSLPSIVP